MNAKQLIDEMSKLTNLDKDVILDMIYEEYFRVASDEQLLRDALILEKYYDGELIEIENEDYTEEFKESFAKRVKRESTGYHLLDPKLVEEEKRTQTGYLIAVMKELGRPLSEDELRELGNIL